MGALLAAPVVLFLSWFGYSALTSQAGSRPPEAVLRLEGLAPAEKLEKIRNALPDVPTQTAVDALFELVREHPRSEAAPDAMELLGQLRLDQIFSTEPADFKRGYLVQPGDSLRGVAIKQNSTPGAVMRANNMLDDTLHPGQRLEIPVLNTNAVLNLPERLLVLYLDGKFLSDYPLEAVHGAGELPEEPVVAEVRDKPSVAAGEIVRYGELPYYRSSRRITLDQSPIILYSLPANSPAKADSSQADDAVDPPAEPDLPEVGVRLSRADMEEVFLLLTGQSRVKIIP